MKIQARKQKAEPKKPVYYLKHGRVGYRYVIGISWIQIETDPGTDWPEMPEYMRVCFAIETPAELDLLDKYAFFPSEEAEKIVLKAIKKKTNEQRKTHGATPDRSKSLGVSADKSGQSQESLSDSKRSKRKPVASMLPFESDDDSALRTESV